MGSSLHPADAALIHDRYDEPTDLLKRVAAMLRRVGAPEDEVNALANASMPVRGFVSAVMPDVLLEDGDKPEVPGWDISAIWTPGHSPGHLCFWEAGNRLMLSGDHVLPRITPNIPFHPQAGADPLGEYLQSLDKPTTTTRTRFSPPTSTASRDCAIASISCAITTSAGSPKSPLPSATA